MDLETITREVVVRGRNEGLDAVARGYEQVAAGAEKATVVVDRQSKVSESAERALNKLKRQIDDNFKANEQMERGEATLARAREQGLISAQDQARQLELLNARYRDGAKGATDAGSAASEFGEKFSVATSFLTRGVGAIGAVGTKVQEMAQRLAESGRTVASGFVSVVGNGLAGLLNPVNLLAAGFAAATVAAVLLYGTIVDKGRSAEQTLENQAKLVALVKDRLDETTEASKRLTLAERETAITRALQTEAELRERIADAQKQFAESLGRRSPNAVSDIPLPDGIPTANDQLEVAARFAALKAPIEQFFDSVRRGAPDVEALKSRLNEIARIDPGQLKLVDKILGDAEELDKWIAKLQELQGTLDRLRNGPTIDPAEAFRKARVELAKLGDEDDAGTKAIVQQEKIREAHQKYSALLQRIHADESGAVHSKQRLAEANRLLASAIAKAVKEEDEEKSALDRQIAAINKHSATLEADAKAIGASVGEHARLRAEAQMLEAVLRDGDSAEDYAEEIKTAGDRAAEAAQKFAVLKLQSDITFTGDTLFLSDTEKQIASILRQVHGDGWKNMMAGPEAGAMRLNATLSKSFDFVKGSAQDFTQTLAQGLMDGKSGTDMLIGALDALKQSLLNSGIKDLFSGDPMQMAIGGVKIAAAFVVDMFSDDMKAAKELQKAKDAFAAMATEVRNFTTAADGFELSAFVTAIQQIVRTGLELVKAALAAEDFAAAVQIVQAGVRQVNNTVDQFIRPRGNTVAEQIAAVNNEAQQIIGELNALNQQYGLGLNRTTEILAAAAQHIAEIQAKALAEIEKRRQTFQDRVFAAANDNATLEGQLAAQARAFQRERIEEEERGSAALSDLIAAQQAEEQALRKSFADKQVAEVERAEREKLDAITRATKGIADYLNDLSVGTASTLSPTARLVAAQSTYNSILALAQGGDVDAMSRVTQDAENFRRAAFDVYGAAGPYQNILSFIRNSLTGLPDVATSDDPVVQALLGVQQAVHGTTAAVDADKMAVTAKLQTAIERLDTSIIDFGTMVTRLTEAVTALTNGAGWLNSIHQLTTTSKAQLELLNQQLSGSVSIITSPPGGSGPGGTVTFGGDTIANNLLTGINKIVWNTRQTAEQLIIITSRQSPAPGAFQTYHGTYALGGTLPAHGFGIMGEHHPQGPFIVQAGAQSIPISPNLPNFGAANDNTLVAEVRALRAQVAAMQRELAYNSDVTAQGNEINRSGHAVTAGTVTAQTETIRAEGRQQRANPQRRAA